METNGGCKLKGVSHKDSLRSLKKGSQIWWTTWLKTAHNRTCLFIEHKFKLGCVHPFWFLSLFIAHQRSRLVHFLFAFCGRESQWIAGKYCLTNMFSLNFKSITDLKFVLTSWWKGQIYNKVYLKSIRFLININGYENLLLLHLTGLRAIKLSRQNLKKTPTATTTTRDSHADPQNSFVGTKRSLFCEKYFFKK